MVKEKTPANGWSVAAVLLTLLAFSGGCAEKPKRLWIAPPVGYGATAQPPRKLFYQVEDMQTGKKETVTIPIDQAPRNLVVEDHKTPSAAPGDVAPTAATLADKAIAQGKLPEPGASKPPSISYLRELQSIEDFYQKQRYSEALIHLSPLLEQYPAQPRLFAMEGTLYQRIGEKRLAAQAYKRAFELDKTNPAFEEAYLRLSDDAQTAPGVPGMPAAPSVQGDQP